MSINKDDQYEALERQRNANEEALRIIELLFEGAITISDMQVMFISLADSLRDLAP